MENQYFFALKITDKIRLFTGPLPLHQRLHHEGVFLVSSYLSTSTFHAEGHFIATAFSIMISAMTIVNWLQNLLKNKPPIASYIYIWQYEYTGRLYKCPPRQNVFPQSPVSFSIGHGHLEEASSFLTTPFNGLRGSTQRIERKEADRI